MVVRFRRKVRKMRGSKTHGYGSKKKHRGAGSRGGRGYAGSHKHKWTYIVKYEPDHFGKHGFVSRKQLYRKRRHKEINVGELEELAAKLGVKSGELLDLASLGYTKLLGKGSIETPFIVKIASFTPRAKEKLESVGGRIAS